jgi:hypothetical protein
MTPKLGKFEKVNRGPHFAPHEHANDTRASRIGCKTNERDALGVPLATAVLAGVLKYESWATNQCDGLTQMREGATATNKVQSASATLPAIPVIDVGNGGLSTT